MEDKQTEGGRQLHICSHPFINIITYKKKKEKKKRWPRQKGSERLSMVMQKFCLYNAIAVLHM